MQLFLSSSFSRGLSSIFCFVLLLSFIFWILKGGGGRCNPHNPLPPLPLDLPMMHTNLSRKVLFFLNLFSKCNGDYPLSAIDAKNSSHGQEQILCTNLTYVLLNCGYFLVLVHFKLKVYSYVYKLTYSLTYLHDSDLLGWWGRRGF